MTSRHRGRVAAAAFLGLWTLALAGSGSPRPVAARIAAAHDAIVRPPATAATRPPVLPTIPARTAQARPPGLGLPALGQPGPRASRNGADGRVAFISAYSTMALQSSRPDGSDLRTAALGDVLPDWKAAVSPDGRKVAFAAYRQSFAGWRRLLPPDGVSVDAALEEIWVVNSDMSSPHRLTGLPGMFTSEPTWSNDGRRIAYVVGEPAGYYGIGYQQQLWVVNADGTQARMVAALPGAIQSPVWSPTRDEVAFVVDGEETAAFVATVSMDQIGAIPARISPLPTNRSVDQSILFGTAFPEWSPKGDQLAYFLGSGLYVSNRDGSGVQRVMAAQGTWYIGGPTWSPDGTRLAFCADGVDAPGFGGPYIVSPGGGAVSLPGASSYCGWPSWSADGGRLAFMRWDDQGQFSHAAVMDVRSGQESRLALANLWIGWAR